MHDLWSSSTQADWRRSLTQYPDAILMVGVAKLPELDRWYHAELPAAIAARASAHVTLPELVRLTEWKMARGVWRAPNLVLVRGNTPELVEAVSDAALATIPHPTKPISGVATLAGVGPATASAVVAAVAPDRYPFFDELVAGQVTTLGAVKWTLGYYAKYAEALRTRATALSDAWTPATVEQALWSNAIRSSEHRPQ